MKPAKLISTGILALFLATSISSVYAQDEKPQEQSAKPDEHAAKPEEHPAKPVEHPNMPAKQQQEAKPGEHPAMQQQGRESESAHVTVNKNVTVVNGQRRIPDATFRTSFGRQHTFTVNNITVISGQPRFQYGGFWLGLGVPWPVAWAYADPVYVEFVDGEYYLFNIRHPGLRIAIIVL
jgi:hypothetical protein